MADARGGAGAQPSRDAYQMYRADAPVDLEAVLQPPVIDGGCCRPTSAAPMHGDVTLPRGSSVVACLYYASVKAWGDDADAFWPGRPKERHLNWNGPSAATRRASARASSSSSSWAG